MSKDVAFSICVPAYKGYFLKRCIASVLAQSNADFELIILNDQSPDPLNEVIADFKDGRIRYYENKVNVGAVHLVDNWNTCLKLAKGTYVMVMGDDDELHPRYLDEFLQLIKAYPDLDVYHCRSTIINDVNEKILLTPSCPTYETVYDSIWHRLEQYRSQYVGDFVYRRESLLKKGGFYKLPLAWGTDDITAYTASYPKGIAHTNKPVFFYRRNSLSITSSGNDEEKMIANIAYHKWLEEFLKSIPNDEYEQVIHAYLVRNLPVFMRKRRRYTLMLSMKRNRYAMFWKWSKNKGKYQLLTSDILYAFLKSFKR